MKRVKPTYLKSNLGSPALSGTPQALQESVENEYEEQS
jgi:hypothetical protein